MAKCLLGGEMLWNSVLVFIILNFQETWQKLLPVKSGVIDALKWASGAHCLKKKKKCSRGKIWNVAEIYGARAFNGSVQTAVITANGSYERKCSECWSLWAPSEPFVLSAFHFWRCLFRTSKACLKWKTEKYLFSFKISQLPKKSFLALKNWLNS